MSEGLTSRVTNQQVVATAVPTRDAAGKLTGVLVGSLLLKPSKPSAGLARPRLRGSRDHRSQGSVAARGLRRIPSGFEEGKRFGNGRVGRPLRHRRASTAAAATSSRSRARTVPGWTVILDRPRSEVFAAARRTLVLEIAPARRRRAARPHPAALDRLARAFGGARRARARARSGGSATSRSTGRDDAAAQPARRRPGDRAIESAARYQPGSTGLEVGGDWFDVLRRPDGIVHITVGDVAGHGVAAAALMGQLRNAFRAYAHEHVSPAALMSRLHRHIGAGRDGHGRRASRSIRTRASSRTRPPATRRRSCATTRPARSRGSTPPSRPCSRTCRRSVVSEGASRAAACAPRSWRTPTAWSSGATA